MCQTFLNMPLRYCIVDNSKLLTLLKSNKPTKAVHIFKTNQSINLEIIFQPSITCSNLTIETQEQDVKYVQS